MNFKRLLLTTCVPGVLAWSACDPDHDHVQEPRVDAGRPDASGATDAAPPDDDTDADLDGGTDDAEVDSGDTDAAVEPDAGDAGDPADAGEEPPPWYEDDQPLALALEGPFGDAFRAAFAGTPDGIIPPARLKDPFAGSATFLALSGAAATHDVELAVRGNSSLQECGFPKIKLAFEQRVDDVDNVFFATKKLKIGTHCGEEAEVNGTIGRLRNEKAAWREELVYRLARALDITTMHTRLATITYTDTSREPAFPAQLTRKAFLLEHVDELARRLGATALPDPINCGEDPAARPNALAVLRIKFLHAMAGNWDFALGPPETAGCGSLMNTEVLVHPDGSLTLVPADFDLAAMVVGEVRNPETNRTEPVDATNAEAWAAPALAAAMAGESSAAVAAIKAEYITHEAELRALITAAPIDQAGKLAAAHMLDGFFAVLKRAR